MRGGFEPPHLDRALALAAGAVRAVGDPQQRCLDGAKLLEVAPQVQRCIDCQTLYERTHFQKTGHTL